jgi:hypothetical protein
VRHQNRPQQHAETLQDTAARIVFPDWQPHAGDWTHLYTGHDQGSRYSEVAVCRGHDRIHYTRISGDDLQPFWKQLMNAHAE